MSPEQLDCPVTRELRNRLFQSGAESAGFTGLQWLYQGVDPETVFD